MELTAMGMSYRYNPAFSGPVCVIEVAAT